MRPGRGSGSVLAGLAGAERACFFPAAPVAFFFRFLAGGLVAGSGREGSSRTRRTFTVLRPIFLVVRSSVDCSPTPRRSTSAVLRRKKGIGGNSLGECGWRAGTLAGSDQVVERQRRGGPVGSRVVVSCLGRQIAQRGLVFVLPVSGWESDRSSGTPSNLLFPASGGPSTDPPQRESRLREPQWFTEWFSAAQKLHRSSVRRLPGDAAPFRATGETERPPTAARAGIEGPGSSGTASAVALRLAVHGAEISTSSREEARESVRAMRRLLSYPRSPPGGPAGPVRGRVWGAGLRAFAARHRPEFSNARPSAPFPTRPP